MFFEEFYIDNITNSYFGDIFMLQIVQDFPFVASVALSVSVDVLDGKP